MRSIVAFSGVCALLLAAGAACQFTSAKMPAHAVGEQGPAAKPSLQIQYERSVQEWREESRWSQVLFTVVVANRGKYRFDLSDLPAAQRDTFVGDVTRFESKCTFFWFRHGEAKKAGELETDKYKQLVVDAWAKDGATLKKTRIKLVQTIMEHAWKSDSLQTLNEIETEFVDTTDGAVPIVGNP